VILNCAVNGRVEERWTPDCEVVGLNVGSAYFVTFNALIFVHVHFMALLLVS